MSRDVQIGNFQVGRGHPHFLIAGPCVIENEEMVLETAARVVEIAQELELPYIFKSSYDKANRTSISSFRGLGASSRIGHSSKSKRSDRGSGFNGCS